MAGSHRILTRRTISAGLLLVTLLAFLISIYRLPEVEDFIAYWSASRLTVRGGNAYDPQAIYQIQLASGYAQDEPLQVWNLPWTSVIFLPFGLLPLPLARALWATISLMILWLSGFWLQRIYWPNPSAKERRFALLIPAFFVQGWAAIKIGQISPLVLLGIVGAMLFYRSRPTLSGAMLILATIKPQICVGALLLFGLRAVVDRSWRFIGGAVGTLGTLLLVLSLLRPTWPSDYVSVLATPLLEWQTPTLATVLRALFPGSPIVELFAVCAALTLLLIAHRTLRTERWNAALAASIVVTMFFTVFAWDFDQLMLLIPVFHLFAVLRRDRRSIRIVGVLLVLLNLMTWLIRVPGKPDAVLFFWVAPVFTLIYLTALLSAGRLTSVATLQVDRHPAP